jgi:hypothetical protein
MDPWNSHPCSFVLSHYCCWLHNVLDIIPWLLWNNISKSLNSSGGKLMDHMQQQWIICVFCVAPYFLFLLFQ